MAAKAGGKAVHIIAKQEAERAVGSRARIILLRPTPSDLLPPAKTKGPEPPQNSSSSRRRSTLSIRLQETCRVHTVTLYPSEQHFEH